MNLSETLWGQLESKSKAESYYAIKYFQFGELVFKIHFLTEDLERIFCKAIAHIEVESFAGIPHATFYILDNEKLDAPIIAPKGLLNSAFNESGICHDFENNGLNLFFQPWFARFSIFNQNTQEGFYWVRSESEVPWWEPSFSFRELFHMATANSNYQLVHAAGIVDSLGKAWIIPAKSGSGKSSTCLTVAQAGYKILGDDFLVIDSEKNQAYALYSFAKIDWQTLENRFPELTKKVLPIRAEAQEKAYIDLHVDFKDQLINSAPISGILLPEISQSNSSVFEKSSSKIAFEYLTHSTAHHLPHQRKATVKKLAYFAKGINAFRWELPASKKAIIEAYEAFVK